MRIDQLLHQQGLAPSRHRAQAMVMAGQVLVNDERVKKPSQCFPPSAQIRLKGLDHPYVSRGGLKLEQALKEWEINPSGKICVDIGASTGGFTDCLLQHGASRVYAFDTGTHQLHFRLRKDPNVIAQENFNVRYLKKQDISEAIDLIVIDVSFISLTLIIPPLLRAIDGPWQVLMLVKPQFEAKRSQVGKGGIVRDEKIHRATLEKIIKFVKTEGLEVQGWSPAALKGQKGNQEFFVLARRK